MNRCKQCGKEIPGYKQFCNRSCSAKYTNRTRKKTKWSEEQKEKVRKAIRVKKDEERLERGEEVRFDSEGRRLKQRCKYCGEVAESRNICNRCREYSGKQSLPRRLGIREGPLDKRYKQAQDKLLSWYLGGQSVPEIAEKIGIPKETIYYNLYLTRKIRTHSEAYTLAIETGRKELSGVQTRYHHGWHTTWQGTKIYYRSSYELEYAKQLDEQRIPYEVETKKIRYFDTVNQRERVAVVDFYLPETNELVEIKSRFTYDEQNMKDKFKAYRDSGYNPILILEKKQIEL